MGNFNTTAPSSMTSGQIQSVKHSCIPTWKDQFIPQHLTATSGVQHAFHWAWLYSTANVKRFYQAIAQMSNMLFFKTSETPPNICCFPHFGRDPAILWTLPEPAVMLSATQEQLGQKSLLGFFFFVCLGFWVFFFWWFVFVFVFVLLRRFSSLFHV